MKDLANPTRRSGNKMVLQSCAVLDQENWTFIPPVDELVNAYYVKGMWPQAQQLPTSKTEVTADHSSYCFHSTLRRNWTADLHSLTKCLNQMFKVKGQIKSIHLLFMYVMRIISTTWLMLYLCTVISNH